MVIWFSPLVFLDPGDELFLSPLPLTHQQSHPRASLHTFEPFWVVFLDQFGYLVFVRVDVTCHVLFVVFKITHLKKMEFAFELFEQTIFKNNFKIVLVFNAHMPRN